MEDMTFQESSVLSASNELYTAPSPTMLWGGRARAACRRDAPTHNSWRAARARTGDACGVNARAIEV